MIKVDLKKIFYMDYLIHIRKTGTAAEFATKVGVARTLQIYTPHFYVI